MTDQITARLDRLEKRCHRLTIGATALGIALVAVVTMGAVAEDEVQDVVRARDFRLIDSEGRVRWSAWVNEHGSGLDLSDEKGKIRWTAAVDEDGPSTVLGDEKGISRAVLGSASLVNPTTGVETKRPEGSLVLFGPDGKVTFEAPR